MYRILDAFSSTLFHFTLSAVLYGRNHSSHLTTERTGEVHDLSQVTQIIGNRVKSLEFGNPLFISLGDEGHNMRS